MLLAATDYVRPDSLQEAVELLASSANARPLAGGQGLLNVLKHRAGGVDLLVDISRLEELRSIEGGGDGSATIGAGVTYAELERSDALRASHPVVAEVASVTVDRQVRNRGTFGGNICFADPASNFPPLVVALGATMNIRSEEHTSELQSPCNLVCRLLLEKKNTSQYQLLVGYPYLPPIIHHSGERLNVVPPLHSNDRFHAHPQPRLHVTSDADTPMLY